MKVSPAGRFWALRPRVTARRLELACWVTGFALTAALVATTTSVAPGPSSPATAFRVFSAPDASSTSYAAGLAVYFQSRCIRRVIALTRNWPELDIGKQIDRQCLLPRVRRGGTGKRTWRTMVCTPAFVWRPPPAAGRPAGCPLA